MIVAAALIGILTAYYFGVRPGLFAGAISLLAFLCAMLLPGAAIPAYLFVGAGVFALCALGPRFGKAGNKANILLYARRGVRWIYKFVRR